MNKEWFRSSPSPMLNSLTAIWCVAYGRAKRCDAFTFTSACGAVVVSLRNVRLCLLATISHGARWNPPLRKSRLTLPRNGGIRGR